MDGGVHEVSKSRTRLSNFHFQKPVKLGSLMPGDIRDTVSILDQEYPLEEDMATPSSTYAWRIPMDKRAW